MTVANNYQPIRQLGNGVTTDFSFNFRVLEDEQIVVYELPEGGEQQVVDSNEYTVNLTNSGGNVVFNTAPANGTVIVITRLTPQTQETPYKTSQGFPAAVVEGDFDKLTMMVQELQQDSDRSVKVDVTSGVTPDVLVDQIERVWSSIDNVDTVADNISNVNITAGSIASVNAVAANTSNINTVAGVASDVATVAAISSDVSGVAQIATEVSGVYYSRGAVENVANNVNDVVNVSDNVLFVQTVANNISNINAVANDLSNIDNASSYAALAKQYAVGLPTEPDEKSAKYWALQSKMKRNIGEIVQSTIPLTDAGLHLLDGALLQGSGSYADFVDYIAGLVPDYPDLFDTEANWQNSVATYGVCDKFVYDSVNNTVRLPKYGNKVYTSSIANSAPTYTDSRANSSGLSHLRVYDSDGNLITGKYAQSGMSTVLGVNPSGEMHKFDIGSNAFQQEVSTYIKAITDLSNITTGLDGYYYIVVANSTKTEIEVDIDEVMTDLNGKADVDMSNVTTSGKSLISGLPMPSNRYTDLTLGASGTNYTAPANGWFAVSKTSGGTGKYIGLLNITSNFGVETYPNVNNNKAKLFIPVKKNDVLQVIYSLTGTTDYFRFIYAEGEPNV